MKILKSPHFYYCLAITGLLILFLLKGNGTGVNKELEANQLKINDLNKEIDGLKHQADIIKAEKNQLLVRLDSAEKVEKEKEIKIIYIDEKIKNTTASPALSDTSLVRFFAEYHGN